MNFQEAKDRTLWKLAFCYSDVGYVEGLYGCDFCMATLKNYAPIKNKFKLEGDFPDCGMCPASVICGEYKELHKYLSPRVTPKQWKHLFDKLLDLPMPKLEGLP